MAKRKKYVKPHSRKVKGKRVMVRGHTRGWPTRKR
jgi:hypothetical protein